MDNLYNSRLRDIEQGVDTYWLSVPLRTGFTHKHNVYAEGGEGNVRYGLGLNFGQVNGVMKGSNRQTLGGNLDLIYRTGNFQFSNKLSIDYLETNNPTVSFSEYAYANPYYRKYGADGKINKYLYYPEEGLNDNPVSNPLWNAHLNNYDKGQRFGFTNNFIAEWFATDDLRVRGNSVSPSMMIPRISASRQSIPISMTRKQPRRDCSSTACRNISTTKATFLPPTAS